MEVAEKLTQAKKELIESAQRAHAAGLQAEAGGNFSGRVPDTELIVIKPSGYALEDCSTENLVTVTMGGRKVEGPAAPSSELPTHLAIYRNRPGVNGVFHTHSPWAISYAALADAIPILTDHAKSRIGRIPVLGPGTGSADETARAVTALLRCNSELVVFVQAGHGIFSFADTITVAEHNTELVEEVAQIAWLVTVGQRVLG